MHIDLIKRFMSLALCIVLIAAVALFTSGCNDTGSNASSSAASSSAASVVESKPTVLGEGKTEFTFTVTNSKGEKTEFEIHTDEETVGAALLELGLIAGEDSAYGLYVKTVNGETIDGDKDNKYWSFLIDGEYAMTGVDTTSIEQGKVYSFEATKL